MSTVALVIKIIQNFFVQMLGTVMTFEILLLDEVSVPSTELCAVID
jgi:hypothetical protein